MSTEKEVMPSLKKHEIESRPRSREKGSTRSRENMSGKYRDVFSVQFSRTD
jgi:hypothetical protein